MAIGNEMPWGKIGELWKVWHITLTGTLSIIVLAASMLDVAAAQVLDRIASTKTLRIGYVIDQPPFSFKDTDGAPRGYAIDLCGQVAQEVGRRIDGLTQAYIESTPADAFDAMAADRFDLLCGALTITLDRRAKVDFSEPIFLTGMSALLRSDSPRDLRELFLGERTISAQRSLELRPFATSRIGVRTGTTTEAVIRRTITDEKYGAQIIGFETHAQGLAALESHDVDAYFADRALLVGLVGNARDPSRLIVASRLFTHEPYGIAMKRGDSDFRLLVDRVLSRFYATPEFTQMLAKHFREESGTIRAQILMQSIPE